MEAPHRRPDGRRTGRALKPDARPLYVQVREILTERIRTGAWAPGAALPNEFEIAAELGVSQGTVRKALDAMAAEHLLVRRQGRGTFVMQHTPANMLFRFFNFYAEDGTQVEPESRDPRVSEGPANRAERARLGLADGARVVRITRLRTWAGKPLLTETIVVPERMFPGLGREPEIPNTLYDFYQRRFAVTVARGEEKLTAVAASKAEARALGIEAGTPLLKIDRVMFTLDERRIEWRLSLCRLEGAHYLARVG